MIKRGRKKSNRKKRPAQKTLSKPAQKHLSNNWSDPRFWLSLTIYFFALSWIGHWIEIALAWILKVTIGRLPTHGIFDNWLEPYWVYGFGVLACITILYPINMRIGRHRILINYCINTVVVAIIEYAAGWFNIWRFGSNPFWNYSHYLFNLHGQVCLQNTLLFGAIATLFTLYVYPRICSFSSS